jgi:hypothetical protein
LMSVHSLRLTSCLLHVTLIDINRVQTVRGGDWTRPSCLLSLLSTVIETDEGPVTARQELVVQVSNK